jgi:hypothetical protein
MSGGINPPRDKTSIETKRPWGQNMLRQNVRGDKTSGDNTSVGIKRPGTRHPFRLNFNVDSRYFFILMKKSIQHG